MDLATKLAKNEGTQSFEKANEAAGSRLQRVEGLEVSMSGAKGAVLPPAKKKMWLEDFAKVRRTVTPGDLSSSPPDVLKKLK